MDVDKLLDLYADVVARNKMDLEKIPKCRRTFEFYQKLIRKNPMYLNYCLQLMDSGGVHTYTLCLEAVRSDWESLEYIPFGHLDGDEILKLCYEAVRISGFALKYIPWLVIEDTHVYNLISTAVRSDGRSLMYAPMDLLSTEETKIIYLEAVHNAGMAIEYVRYIDDEEFMESVVKTAYESHCLSIFFLPLICYRDLRVHGLIMDIINEYPETIFLINDAMRFLRIQILIMDEDVESFYEHLVCPLALSLIEKNFS